ncbi:hypothetical protein COCC4DRAFT_30114 [Bipolaris maydis ATCC 48331]|uniref:Uncharacterized protein n=2 Tax=Cochliobolus heterostrophus TaxID=5016 RepID=M2URI3_COCH5|nr:uncharacterized protein COCC4DRAFT_30114 [Bipolaris maydis ATCC 48331]EMD90502.1 hypothetical protein COCHEDRAFT_1022393 [Bipolaris maydis C5]ENI09286.1 hypothetical protein COCC4DRAFT_30114 [Bipolaris maydis ATCC 48331]
MRGVLTRGVRPTSSEPLDSKGFDPHRMIVPRSPAAWKLADSHTQLQPACVG